MKFIAILGLLSLFRAAQSIKFSNSNPQDPLKEQDLFRDYFGKYDRNKDGFLSSQELSKLVKNAKGSDKDAQSAVTQLDTDHDGKISYDELKTIDKLPEASEEPEAESEQQSSSEQNSEATGSATTSPSTDSPSAATSETTQAEPSS